MSKRLTVYEWDLEVLDLESGDIEDHHFSDKCPGLPMDKNVRLVLVRDTWRKMTDEEMGRASKYGVMPESEMTLENRQWAYIEDGLLPKEFDGGSKIPERFRLELKKAQVKLAGDKRMYANRSEYYLDMRRLHKITPVLKGKSVMTDEESYERDRLDHALSANEEE